MYQELHFLFSDDDEQYLIQSTLACSRVVLIAESLWNAIKLLCDGIATSRAYRARVGKDR